VPHKLLLADDSVTIQRVIELTFADEDIQVVAVGDGDQAIARLEADPPDIVLADVGMPGRNGYEVSAYVKKSPRLAHIPVVLLTGAFEPVDQPRAEAAGCDGVLAKPFEPQLVISRVKELLARPRAPRSLDAEPAPPPAPATQAWTPASADPPIAPPAPPAPPAQRSRPAAGTGTDDYFDRLDAAFASLSSGTAAPARPAAWNPAQDNPIAETIDWFSQKSGSAANAAPPPAPAPVLPASAPRPSLPPLADAFAALLAAEQSAPASSASPAAPQWPGSVPAAPVAPPPPVVPAPLVITDDVVEQVTRRVLERLSDQVVHDTVTQIVTATAERLVREEIERIKNTIK